MCKEASFVLTKDRTFWSKTTDSHEEIISEYRLHADGAGGPNIVRVEITPAGNDYTLPVDQWVYRVDQDELPDWYDAEECEARVREALPAWANSKLVLPGETRNVKAGGYVARVYGTVQAVYDGGTVQKVYDGGLVKVVYGGGVVVAYTKLPNIKLMTPTAVLLDRSESGKVVMLIGK